jgi:predicted RNA-binding protein YlqC (UPF0109 family)
MSYVKELIALVRKQIATPDAVTVKQIKDAHTLAVCELELKHLDNLHSVIMTLNKK